ncbi:SH3 domain-containing protein [Verrucomicrobium spinosum]|uniref:SH3 domain-containing protein n=1 Tax=Verrucomicrobium spinosum TaxID=2736 RepID=UPI0001745544|nr:SH3 domain-containing protein [Verrucomicrobium spinosum]
MKALLSAWLGLVLAPTLFAVDPPPKLSVDLTGNGMSQTYTVELSRSNPDSDFESAVLKAGKESIPLGKDFTGFTVALEAHRVSGDQPAKVLEVTAEGDSDYLVRYFFAMVNGQLKQVGKVKGQGDLKVPGNGTLIATDWMGFWMKTEKYVFGKDLTLTQIPQEFYSLAIEETSGIEGTVVTSFPVYQTRDGKTVLANTRKGSKFRVLLWDPSSAKPGDDIELMGNQWYLIRTESGFTGWVRAKYLEMEFAELPWAG